MSPQRSSLARKLLLGIGLPGFVMAGIGYLFFWQEALAKLTGADANQSSALEAVFQQAAVGVVIFWIAVTVATFVSLRAFLTRPIERLAKVMRKAQDGDFVVRADESRGDEIGQLSASFNRLLENLTSMKAAEIDTNRDLAAAQQELALKKEVERRVADLTLLYDVSRSLNSTLSLQELLTRISHLVGERLKVPKFSIMLVTDEGKLEVKSAYPVAEGVVGMNFELGHGACGRAAQTRQPVYLPDLQGDTEVFVRRRPGTPEYGSLLAVPITHQNNVLGVLNLERPDKAAFAQEEIELLLAVADQAAIAVQNARLHEQTVALSITDALTGAPNRRHLMTRMEMEVARANRFGTQLSILMVDIDHFKQLNDANGHRAGDEVLRLVADILRANIRKVDLLARYGGEEFMIVLPQVPKGEGIEVAEKLRKAIEETQFEYGPSQPLGMITISVGVANLPVDASTQDALVDAADSALYACKRAGRNKAIGYAAGMELHPGRERGPHALKRRKTGETPIPVLNKVQGS